MTDDLTLLIRRPGESSESWGERLVGDLAQRHRRGARRPIEDYLRRFPELGNDPDTLSDLVVAEWTLRRQAGEPFTLTEYLGRFPGWEIEMTMLWDADQQVSPAAERAADRPPAAGWPSWYTEPTPPPVEYAGYRLVRELGGGGMARVFVAEPGAGGEAVVLKVPKLPGGQDEESVRRRASGYERFLREARHTRDLDHPHLCRAIEVRECDGLPYFTMRYYPDGSIADELRRRGRFPAREAAGLIMAVAEGLQYAHERDILHRDVKPSNLLRGGPSGVVVSDFGLALLLDAEELRLTSTGHILGTPLYVSPEQAMGQELTPASDVFCLGGVLYEMLSGQAPFHGNSSLKVLQAVQAAAPTPLEELVPNLPPAPGAICRKAMARLPADRYESMMAFADDLRRFLDGTWAPPPSPAKGDTTDIDDALPKPRGRRRPLVIGLVIALGLLVGIVLARGFLSRPPAQPTEQRPPAVSSRKPVGYRGQLQGMHDDLNSLDATLRPHVRYFSLTAVHDNLYVGAEEWNAYVPALKRVLNRLSLNARDVPIYVDSSGYLVRIDLRDLGWHPALEWRTLLRAEPYGVRYDTGNPDELLRKLARETYALAGVNSLFEAPVVRGDWFIAAASQPPLVNELLQVKDVKTPVFETTGPDDPLEVVLRVYRKDLDAAAVAAELGLGTVEEIDALWPPDRAEMRKALDQPLSRSAWAGEDGAALFAESVRALKLGVSRATQGIR
jgi:serine/threonine protein kinase